MTQPTVINLHPNEYIQGLRYYPLAVIQTDVLEVVILLMIYPIEYVFQTKQKMLINLSVYNKTTGINKSKKSTKHTSCKCKHKFDSRKCNSNQSGITINVGVSAKIQKKIMCAKEIIFGILLHIFVKMANIQELLLTIQ